jgi:hypothetical protein
VLSGTERFTESCQRFASKRVREYKEDETRSVGDVVLAAPLTRTLLQSHAGPVVIQELDAALFKGRLHLKKCGSLGVYCAVEGLHAPHGADGHLRRRGEPRLIPSQENARRPQLPAIDESH